MIFLDLDNFRRSLYLRDEKRFYDFGKFPYYMIKYLSSKLNYKDINEESLIRTYAYTGEYTLETLKKIKEKDKLEEYEKRMKAQRSFFEIKKTMCHHTLKVFCCGKKSPAGECGLIGTCFLDAPKLKTVSFATTP